MLNSGVTTLGGFRIVDSREEFASATAEHIARQNNVFTSGNKRLNRPHNSIEPNQRHNDKPEPTIAQSNTTDSFNNNFGNRSPVHSGLCITPDEGKIPRILKLSFKVKMSALQTCEQVYKVGVRLVRVVKGLPKFMTQTIKQCRLGIKIIDRKSATLSEKPSLESAERNSMSVYSDLADTVLVF
ncbi:unnamed protein product [Polarella glacialis]|uniref:Uncharacterized protein n=1 Tax=Polarella glacialis TaxID=89957 RepID=A0A813K0W0_POLGL|nr:unnamed protein product [Polarella glacialis]